MRFLPSTSRRAIAEALLAMAVVAFVVYDLGDHSAKPEFQNVTLSFEGKEPSEVSRFETTVSPSIGPEDTFDACGEYLSQSSTLLVGNGTNQALIIYLGGSCPLTLTFYTASGNPGSVRGAKAQAQTLTAITVNANSWISFQNVASVCSLTTTCNLLGAFSGQLTLLSGANFEVIFPSPTTTSDTGVVTYALIHAQGTCSSTTGVNFPITNCPTNPAWSLVGQKVCQVVQGEYAINGVTYCNYLATISGLTQKSVVIYMIISKDCSTFTILTFKTLVATFTGIPAEAQLIQVWQCSSITLAMQILGTTTTSLAAALATFLAAVSPGGPLNGILGVLAISVGTPLGVLDPASTIPVTAGPTNGFYGVPYCDYYFCPTTLPFNPSRSNPALLALLTLLVIPVAIFVGLLIRCCLPRAPCCEPMPICPAAPACPPVYYAEPYACPCPDPCYQEAAPAYCTPAPTPAVASL